MSLLVKVRRIPLRYWVYYLPLIAAAVGFGVFLDDAALPWEEGVEAREAAGKVVKSPHRMVTGLWFGAWACLALLAVLAAAGLLAARGFTSDFRRRDASLGRRSTAVFLAFAAVAVAIAASHMVPRLDSSLWGDEDYTVRRAIVGQYERDPEGQLWFREASWADTLFYYRTPNNHVLYSILARVAHQGYEPGDDPKALHFDETRLRTPALLFGLGAIISVGYLLAVMGYKRAGLAAMFLLALHPWFLRHACEARGYPVVMALAPLTLAFLVKALRRGRGVYWCAFAASQALAFYAYPGIAYLLLGINLAAIGYLILGRPATGGRDRLTLLARWFTANVLSTLPIVFLMMPNLPQLRAYVADNVHDKAVGAGWIGDNLSLTATGIPWSQPEPDNPLRLALGNSPALSAVLLVLFFSLLVLGLVRLVLARRPWLAVGLGIPSVLLLGHSLIGKLPIYQWYSVPMLPFLVALVALGLEYFPSRISNVRHSTLAGLGALTLFLIAFAPSSGRQIRLLKSHSIEPLRESVELTRAVLNPSHPEIGGAITVGFCQGTPGYDPTAYFFKPQRKDPEAPVKLIGLMRRADAEGKPLHVNIGLPGLARRDWPGLMELVDDPNLFEALPPIYGMQSPCTRFLFRYRPNSSASLFHLLPSADGS